MKPKGSLLCSKEPTTFGHKNKKTHKENEILCMVAKSDTVGTGPLM